jgi:ferritin-like metal-binding protein YciE
MRLGRSTAIQLFTSVLEDEENIDEKIRAFKNTTV